MPYFPVILHVLPVKIILGTLLSSFEVTLIFDDTMETLPRVPSMTSRGTPSTTVAPMTISRWFKQCVTCRARNLHGRSSCGALTRGLSPSHHQETFAESFITFSAIWALPRWTSRRGAKS